MIIGFGTDIIDNSRIKNLINKFDNKFKSRCFTVNEINNSNNKRNSVNYFAKRYAAKEACVKALGTGFTGGILWKDIEIFNNSLGKPYIKLHNKALDYLNKLSKFKCKLELSLSDEKNYSIASVIIFKI